MTRRLFASDLDGTLVRSDGTISPRSRAAIAAVEDAGSVFVMVTGRPPRWMAGVAQDAGHHGLAICANGAVVYDLHTEQVVTSHLLDADAALEVVAALRREVPGVAFARESAAARFGHEPAYRPRWDQDDKDVLDVTELVVGGVVKLLVRHEAMTGDELLAAAREALGDLVETTHSSADGLLEISARGISKATGLAALAEQHGLSAADCVAFGDMPNDIPMLIWAEVGYAVANAHPAVLEVADEVTASNDDDGVAAVIERLLPL
ncbi:MAG TPA: HAD family hydrolase [Mycobacteriales bacterium]|nr:HAD family hydrolase [Mycobacteriales bacterium]